MRHFAYEYQGPGSLPNLIRESVFEKKAFELNITDKN